MTDWDLIREYSKHRSERAFSLLVERHMAFVYHVCRRDVDDEQSAQDSALAVFLVLARKAHTLRQGTVLKSWLFTTARFVAKNAEQQRKRRIAAEQKATDMAKEEQATSTDNSASAFIEAHLNDALAALSPRERDAILLRFENDLAVAEVAQALDISQAAAQKRLTRALEKMRAACARNGVSAEASVMVSVLVAAKSQSIPAALLIKAATLSGAISLAPPATVAVYQGAMKAMWITKMKLAAAIAAGVVVVGAVSHNAYDYYSRAGGMITAQTVAESGDEARGVTNLQTDEALVQANQDALNVLKQGLTYNYSQPPSQVADLHIKDEKFITLGRLLEADARIKESQGDWEGATDTGLDEVRFGTDISPTTIIGAIEGINSARRGRAEVWDSLSHLSSQQAIVAGQRLDIIDARRTSLNQILLNAWNKYGSSPIVGQTPSDRPLMAQYQQEWADVVAQPFSPNADLPQTPAFSNAAMTASGEALYDNLWLRFEVDETGTALLKGALALQAYHDDHGSYPNSLDVLVPKYLSRVPVDPFGDNAPLRYRTNESGCFLYSVGPDGVDDGGTPISVKGVPFVQSAGPGRLTPYPKGDIVAGINGF